MNANMRSETNLAVVTIKDPGSLNVWALCSMYRTSHISEEIRLKGNQN